MLCVHNDNMVYLPVPKNASTAYVSFFIKNGWISDQIENIDVSDKILFGHIQNPHVRPVSYTHLTLPTNREV